MVWSKASPLARLRARRAHRARVAIEDALRHLHAADEHDRPATVESLAGALGVSTRAAAELVRTLQERGLATVGAGLGLTASGERWARAVVRAHRVWERHLADEVGTPAANLHRLADRAEHRLEPGEVERIAARLGYPERDPHGDPIPTAAGELGALTAVPLTVLAEGAWGEIAHLEDEPEAVFAKLAELGLEPGQAVVSRGSSRAGVRFEVDGVPCELPAVAAANLFVSLVSGPPPPPRPTLAGLGVGELATVGALRVAGFARRRLLDLGFTPGATVECELASSFGDTRAYRIRGTLIALRPDEARRIEIARAGPGPP
ncbi:MAG: metal-dependent transcriptional regulator [Thermoleophilia bacterium]|nr:metal-dependent transcriptional regulator [Thermoleophilia bacterium]